MSIWYDKSKLLSYNMLLNIVIGLRGGGKTYGFKKWAIDDFIKNKKQFVWLRRFNSELVGDKSDKNGVIKSFFDDIRHEFEGHELNTKGHTILIDGEEAGYFVPLSTSQRYKSKPYPNVNKIIFDEFLIQRGSSLHYIKGEAELLLEFFETVARLRDDVRLVLIGNAISFNNPYFIYYAIKPFKGSFYVDRRRGLIVEMYTNDDFIKAKENTRFGRLISGTRYGDYAVKNEFLLDSDTFLEKRTKESVFRFAVKYGEHTLGFWLDFDTGVYYVNRKWDKTSRSIYTLRKEDHDINLLLIKKMRGTLLDEAIYCFERGYMRFEDQAVKALGFEVLNFFIK